MNNVVGKVCSSLLVVFMLCFALFGEEVIAKLISSSFCILSSLCLRLFKDDDDNVGDVGLSLLKLDVRPSSFDNDSNNNRDGVVADGDI